MKIFRSIDIKLLKILVWYYTIVAFLNFLSKLYWKLQINPTNNIVEDRYITMDWFTLIFHNILIDWVIVISIMIVIASITKKMLKKKWKWKTIIIIHSVLSLLITWLIFSISTVYFYIIGALSYSQAIGNLSFNKTILNRYINVLDVNFLIYTSMLGIIITYYYIKETKKIEEEKAMLSIQLTNAKMNVLKSQLQPHFLFNTLNSIHALIEEDVDKSQEMLTNLSDLLRGIVNFKEENYIELQKELKLLQKYIEIVKVRFEDDLQINLNVENNLKHVLVPGMLFQPIIENAIKYGYSENVLKLEILINVFEMNNLLHIHIANNGEKLKDELSVLLNRGNGLVNIKKRLQTLYGDNYSLKMFQKEDKVITEISMPIQLAFSVFA